MKSNLGQYLFITKMSKKVGSPYMLMGIMFIGGFIGGHLVPKLISHIYKSFRRNKKQIEDVTIVFNVYTFHYINNLYDNNS